MASFDLHQKVKKKKHANFLLNVYFTQKIKILVSPNPHDLLSSVEHNIYFSEHPNNIDIQRFKNIWVIRIKVIGLTYFIG